MSEREIDGERDADPYDIGPGVKLTPEQAKRRRGRSLAIALALIAFVVIVFLATQYRLGVNVSSGG